LKTTCQDARKGKKRTGAETKRAVLKTACQDVCRMNQKKKKGVENQSKKKPSERLMAVRKWNLDPVGNQERGKKRGEKKKNRKSTKAILQGAWYRGCY